jgi:hypothetical protein
MHTAALTEIGHIECSDHVWTKRMPAPLAVSLLVIAFVIFVSHRISISSGVSFGHRAYCATLPVVCATRALVARLGIALQAGRGIEESEEMKTTSTYPLRLPRSVKAAAEKMAQDEGISLNQFVATAVAEKLAVMNTADFLAERKARADLAAFKRILKRKGGEPPRPGDERR